MSAFEIFDLSNYVLNLAAKEKRAITAGKLMDILACGYLLNKNLEIIQKPLFHEQIEFEVAQNFCVIPSIYFFYRKNLSKGITHYYESFCYTKEKKIFRVPPAEGKENQAIRGILESCWNECKNKKSPQFFTIHGHKEFLSSCPIFNVNDPKHKFVKITKTFRKW